MFSFFKPLTLYPFQCYSTALVCFHPADDSELPGWSMFCIGHNERYLSAAPINDGGDDLSVSIFNVEPWWTLIIRSCIYNIFLFCVLPFFPDDTNDGYHIILKWIQRRETLLFSFRPDPVSPSTASYSSLFLEYVEMLQESPRGRRRNMRPKHPALPPPVL